MAATNDAGKILITPKGEYNGSTTYEILDAVYYISSSVKGVYVAKGTTTGNLPTDTTKWDLFIDLSTFVVNSTLATTSTVGLVKPDGITEEVDALGVLTALGVVIKAEIDSTATPYGSAWLKVGTTTLTPSTKQMYRVTESGYEHLYYWNGTNYVKVATGHIIVNSAGTEFTQRSKLKITGATIVDDPSNDQTLLNITGGGGGGTPISLIEDTVGWTGKNRAYSQENNAVIADIKNGVTYNVSWTGSATVTLRKNSSEGTEITHGSTSPLSFTADSNYSLYFGSSADVTEIMVYDANITDSTFEPYHESVESLFEDVADDIDGINHLDVNLEMLKKINTSGTWNNNAYTHNGITFTVDDESINVNGTLSSSYALIQLANYSIVGNLPVKNGSYTLSGRPESISGNANLYQRFYNPDGSGTNNDDYGSGVTVNYLRGSNYNIAISVSGGSGKTVTNAVVKPMLTDAKYAGIPYRPYNQQSIQHQINDITGVTGVRNRLENQATTTTTNGVTFTVNNDPDSPNYKTITVNGTATANTPFIIPGASGVTRPISQISDGVLISGNSDSSGDVFFEVVYRDSSDGYISYERQSGGVDLSPNIPSNAAGYRIDILVPSGKTVTNKIIKPMIRSASDPDDTYVPFAMNNRELTDKLNTPQTSACTNIPAGATVITNSIRKYGKFVYLNLRLSGISGTAYLNYASIPNGFRPIEQFSTLLMNITDNSIVPVVIKADGGILTLSDFSNKSMELYASYCTE